MEKLRAAARRRVSQAFRPGTIANHRSHHILYLAFCDKFFISPLPAAPLTLQLFLEFLLTTYASPRSALNVISSVKVLHLVADADTTAFTSYSFSLSKRSVINNVRHLPSRAPPLPPSLLVSLVSLSLTLGPPGVAFAALLAVTFNSLARVSSLVPASESAPDLSRTVLIADLAPTNSGYALSLKWTKTLQASDRAVVLPILRAPLSPACAATRLSALLLQLVGAPPTLPLFAWPVTSGTSPTYKFFTLNSARHWLDSLLRHGGNHQSGYTFHSFRRGGATAAFAQGASLDEVKALGTWASDAALLYIPQAMASYRAASRLVSHLQVN